MSVAVVTMTKNPANLEYWLDYHVKKGIAKVYVRLEVDSPEEEARFRAVLEPYARTKKVVFVVGRSTDRLSSKAIVPEAEMKLNVPGQAQMIRQRVWVSEAIRRGLEDGVKWLVHIDTDELLDCEGSVGRAIERDVRGDDAVQTLVLPNVEAVYAGVSNAACFEKRATRECSAGGCASYANGKGAGRVTPHLHEHGVHRFRSSNRLLHKEIELVSLKVVHFESCDFDAYMKKFLSLAGSEAVDFPFKYYNDSVAVARGKECVDDPRGDGCVRDFERVYRTYRT